MPCNPLDFSTFRKLEKNGELDGLIIAGNYFVPIINICKFYGIRNVAYMDLDNPFSGIFWLDNDKDFLPYLETNLIDSCNLNCKACTHYANLFTDKDVYDLENFRRDCRQLSENINLAKFRLMGGEPLKLENLDQYIKIARQYFPNTHVQLVTNGLLVPNAPQKIFDALRDNFCTVDISAYPPTLKMTDKIVDRLTKNNIHYYMLKDTKNIFFKFLSLKSGHDTNKSRIACCNQICRFLRDGKIYKCPVDALSYKFVEHFNIENFPLSTGVDIYAKNFSMMLEQLNGNIELCSWCTETHSEIDWKIENKPQLSDWLAE